MTHAQTIPLHSIYQIYFSKEQLPLLEKDFIPYDNSACKTPELREYAVFKKIYDEKSIEKSVFTGAVSWKFRQKASIPGKKFCQFIEDNTDCDVLFINPFPHQEIHKDGWAQGEWCHPGITALTQHIFDHIHYDIDLKKTGETAATAAYCNFWVGNQTFWKEYMTFTLPVFNYIMHETNDTFRAQIFAVSDKKSGASYFPFIMERLFSTFLHTHPAIRYKKYIYTGSELRKKYYEIACATIKTKISPGQGKLQESETFFQEKAYHSTTQYLGLFLKKVWYIFKLLWRS